mmetsp:Transcript_6228/g.10378  ORF Transcript_6228/g.10378 Transcript_6228/m.10378 type:complete len:355 (+) Transcript_6228:75-1139(+)
MSDRHAVMARMHARRANRSTLSDYDDEVNSQSAHKRVLGDGHNAGDTLRSTMGNNRGRDGAADPWAPPWNPDSSKSTSQSGFYHRAAEAMTPRAPRAPPPPASDSPCRPTPWNAYARSPKDCDDDGLPAAPPAMPAMPSPPSSRAPAKERPVVRCAMEDDLASSGRVRGPAAARAARQASSSHAVDADSGSGQLPSEVNGASFAELQAMIAQEIKESESSASALESHPSAAPGLEEELRRRTEENRRRREAEAEEREHQRQQARLERQRAEERRQREQAEQMAREEQEEVIQRKQNDAKKQEEEQCLREYAAIVRIQAHIRGYRSRKGRHVPTPALPLQGLGPHTHSVLSQCLF